MGDKTDIWMPLFIGDYLSSTSRLTTEQHGAYLLLIMDYWKNGQPPDNDQVLAQITRLSPDAWSMHRAVLERFFSIENGHWVHRRIERELSDANTKKRKAQDKAKAAAEARWREYKGGIRKDNGSNKQCSEHATSNARSNAKSNASAVHEECPSPSPSPSQGNSKPSTDPVKKPDPTENADFLQAMAVYPRRAGANPKRRAAQAFAKRVKEGDTPAMICAGVTRYARFILLTGKDGTEFVMQAATFFGPDRHYLNPFTPPPGGGGNGQNGGSSQSRDEVFESLGDTDDKSWWQGGPEQSD